MSTAHGLTSATSRSSCIGFSVAFARMISLVLIMALGVQISFARPPGKQEEFVARVKAKVSKLGTGKNARAIVKCKDGRKLKGYVSESGEEHFTIVDKASNDSIRISYDEVARVKRKKFPTWAKVAIGVGASCVGFLLILVISRGGLTD